jgi:hypothetical protein
MYIILLCEGLAVHPKLFRGPPVDRDERLAQGWHKGGWVCALSLKHLVQSMS